eukprot:scaffold46220_cov34-Cyclotella_meneghiniana.AAC.2
MRIGYCVAHFQDLCVSTKTALTLSEEKTATGRPLKSAQFSSLRFHLRARLIDVQKKSIFETVKRLKVLLVLTINYVEEAEERYSEKQINPYVILSRK